MKSRQGVLVRGGCPVPLTPESCQPRIKMRGGRHAKGVAFSACHCGWTFGMRCDADQSGARENESRLRGQRNAVCRNKLKIHRIDRRRTGRSLRHVRWAGRSALRQSASAALARPLARNVADYKCTGKFPVIAQQPRTPMAKYNLAEGSSAFFLPSPAE